MSGTVLVVGCGSIGQRHLRNLAALGVSRLVAIDPDGERRAAAAEAGAVTHAELVPALDEKPDAVIVATPPALHAAPALAALERGAHVFVEKPLAASVADGRALVEAAAPARGVLRVGYQFRFHPAVRMLKRLVDDGAVGRPLMLRAEVGQYLPDWRPAQDYRTTYNARADLGGGIILDATHEIDYTCWLMGDVCAVSAIAERLTDLEIEVEDTALVIGRLARGGVVEWHLDTVQRAYSRGAKIVGDAGTLVWDWPDVVRLYRASSGAWESFRVDFDVNRVYVDEMRAFLDAAVGDAQAPGATAPEAFRVLEIALAARRAAAERREVVV
jgi:predicted dehydrogenase